LLQEITWDYLTRGQTVGDMGLMWLTRLPHIVREDVGRVALNLAGQLDGTVREQVLQRGLEAALGIDNEEQRFPLLTAYAPLLAGELLAQSLRPQLLPARNHRARCLAVPSLRPQLS
jgi:hypothetical protein